MHRPATAGYGGDQYAGKPLDLDDSFRLLELQPGQTSDRIVVRLLNSSLSELLEYECLSYAWGEASQVAEILVLVSDDGTQAEGQAATATANTMEITLNCYAALLRLRRTDKPRILWVDSICINQTLVSERNHQLALMGRIYRSAARVNVYLGSPDHGTDAALAWIREIDRPSDYGMWPSTRNYSSTGKTIKPDITSMKALFRRRWFHRVWVLQEIILAKEGIVLCGDQELEWASFQAFAYWNTTMGWVGPVPYSIQYLRKLQDRWAHHYVAYTKRLLSMLQETRHCGATDARDKVYALLPLLEWEQEQMRSWRAKRIQDPAYDPERDYYKDVVEETLRITADYGRSAQQVFTDAALLLMPKSGLDFLENVLDFPVVPGCPSWVPDWSTPVRYKHQKVMEPRAGKMAGFKEPPTQRWASGVDYSKLPEYYTVSEYIASSTGEPTKQLHLKGVVAVGAITGIGDVCDVDNDFFPLGQWKSVAADPKYHGKPVTPDGLSEDGQRRYDNGPRSLTPFMRVLSADDVVYPEVIVPAVERIAIYNGELNMFLEGEEEKAHEGNMFLEGEEEKAYVGNMFQARGAIREKRETSGSNKLPLALIFDNHGSYGQQAKNIFEACDGRRLFVTDTGYLGLGPAGAAIGDRVCVVAGARSPGVFRETARQSQSGSSTATGGAPGGVTDNGIWEFLGFSFVHGVMYGEVWQEKEEGQSPTTVQRMLVR